MTKILEFKLGGNYYAMDIHFTREIVESLPITPIPRTPGFIAGMTNIRGEITTIIAIHELIGISSQEQMPSSEKFIIFVPEAAKGDNIGMMVDEVYSVLDVNEEDIEYSQNGDTNEKKTFIKGVIRLQDSHEGKDKPSVSQRLVLYLDIDKLISDLFEKA
ncbi:MAG: chemotaxis protein CheW [Methanolinea sp.]|jgi:purine-binding chemotaxis protein CheW|nr:purine-binding chemotaxis protein CheW [Methanolinea sp.]